MQPEILPPPVCVLLLNWNGWRDTIECLESLFRSEYENFRVVVCDNGSADGSLSHIKAWATGYLDTSPRVNCPSVRALVFPPLPKQIRHIELDRLQVESGHIPAEETWDLALVDIGGNLGFAGGNNVGLRLSLNLEFEYVWVLNNDTVVASRALSALVERMQSSPAAGICGSTLLYYDNPGKVQAWGGGYYCKWIGLPWHQGRLKKASDPINRDRAERRMNYIVGASMLVSRKFLLEVGLMCEDYFLYFEEIDWTLRGKGKYGLAYAPDSIVYHKVGGSIGTSSNPRKKSFACDYYNVRNRLLFTRRYFPGALPTVYLSLGCAILVRLLLGQWERAWMIARLLFGFEDRKSVV